MSSCTGRDLRFIALGDAQFELRLDASPVATLYSPRSGTARATAADGEWWLSNPRGTAIDAGVVGAEAVIARYRPKAAGGGKVTALKTRYILRAPVLGDKFTLRRRLLSRPVALIERKQLYTVRLTDIAADVPQSSLVILLVLEALLVEEGMPPGVPGSSY
jgi:hypothetical protein